MTPTEDEVEKYATQMRLEHNQRVAKIMRRGLGNRALDSALRESEEKRDRAVKKFREGVSPSPQTLSLMGEGEAQSAVQSL
jgi:hypothetical protein